MESTTHNTQHPLRRLLAQNIWFFGAMAAFGILGAVLISIYPKGAFIFYFSDHRSAFGDAFFRVTTRLGEAYGYVAAFFVLLLVRYRSALTIPMIGAGVGLTAFLTKTLFRQPRPGLYFRERGLIDQIIPVDGVTLHQGMTSMPSGHTMAAFALFAFMAFCFPEKRVMGMLCFLLALAVGVSRIYLAQHFGADVYFGGLLGVVIAVLFYFGQEKVRAKPGHWLDKNLIHRS